MHRLNCLKCVYKLLEYFYFTLYVNWWNDTSPCWSSILEHLEHQAFLLTKSITIRFELQSERTEYPWAHRYGQVTGWKKSVNHGWNAFNGTENMPLKWTRLLTVAPYFNKVAFQTPAMEATASRMSLSGCCDLGVHIHFSAVEAHNRFPMPCWVLALFLYVFNFLCQ